MDNSFEDGFPQRLHSVAREMALAAASLRSSAAAFPEFRYLCRIIWAMRISCATSRNAESHASPKELLGVARFRPHRWLEDFLQILERGFLWLALQMDQVILLLVISEGHIIRYLCRRQHGLELSAA